MNMNSSSCGTVAESEQLSTSQINPPPPPPPPQNPLMMDVVLKHLFELSSPEELSRARLLSKQWYNVALPVWLKKGSTIVIKSDKENDAFLKFLKEAHLNPSTNHEDIVGIKQYRKFRLEHHGQMYSRLHFQVFWNECGQHLTHLTLNHLKMPDAVTFRDILFCKSTPNLEYLTLDVKSIEGPTLPKLLNYRLLQPPAVNLKLKTLMIDIENMNEFCVVAYRAIFRHFPLDWKSILNNYPNLKHFAVGRGISQVRSQRDAILMAIQEIRLEDKGNLDLKSLKWFFNQCSGCLPNGVNPSASSISPLSLRQCQLSLEAFSFCFSREDENGELAEVVEDVLSLYSVTLRKLQICREVPFQRSPFRQIMNQLHTLELTGYIVKDLTFLKGLPNLRSLRLWDTFDDDPTPYPETLIPATADNPDMAGIAFPTISEFCCNYFGTWNVADFTGLTRLMPNINRLGIYLGDGDGEFLLVCQSFPQVEYLDLYSSTVGDDQILGFTLEGGDPESYGHANIERLQNLKSLTLKVRDDFSRNSVIYGLLRLPCLEKLVIEVYMEEVEEDAEMKEFILEKIPFAKVITVRDFCRTCGRTSRD